MAASPASRPKLTLIAEQPHGEDGDMTTTGHVAFPDRVLLEWTRVGEPKLGEGPVQACGGGPRWEPTQWSFCGGGPGGADASLSDRPVERVVPDASGMTRVRES